ncbi:MAG: ATP-binding protein [Clostridium sp.]|uniref:ATP-binding protein n=1 Tax=Clostridium sp. TaxID=1506 RepID=UPI002FCBB57B
MKKYKIHICAFVIFIGVLIIGNLIIDLYQRGLVEEKMASINTKSSSVTNEISQYINTAACVSNVIASLVSESKDLSEVEGNISNIIKSFNMDFQIEVAPKGYIQYVYPSTEVSKKLIGKSIYEHTSQKGHNKLLTYGNKTYVSEFMTLFDGTKGMIIRSYLYSGNMEESNSGAVSVIIREEQLVNIVEKHFNGQYNYNIVSGSAKDDNYMHILGSENYIKDNEKLAVDINLMDKKWKLNVSTKSIGEVNKDDAVGRIMVLAIAMVVYIKVYLIMKYAMTLKYQYGKINKAKEKIRRSEQKYKGFFEMSPDFIFVIDPNKKIIIEKNKYFNNVLEINSLDEIKCSTENGLVNGEYIIDLCSESEDVSILRAVVKGKNGKNKEVDIHCRMLSEENNQLSIICVGRDLAFKRKIEEMEKAQKEKEKLLNEAIEYDKVKTEFFANMSHELRTPLNVILGSLQLVNLTLSKSNDDIKPTIEKSNKVVKQNCYRLLRIISNIIDITKFESNYLHLEIKQVNMVSLIEDITLSIIDYANSKNVVVEFDTDIEEVFMLCDPDKIERIILNLLSNAIKFTNPGDNIYVNVKDYNDNIEIIVKDTGIGIPSEKVNLIFERFRQVNKSFIREHEGSGIGLSLVKSLVEMHGGNIYAESKLGTGSEFVISLPKKYLETEVDDECAVALLGDVNRDFVEKISIEFSDIYFN